MEEEFEGRTESTGLWGEDFDAEVCSPTKANNQLNLLNFDLFYYY